MNKKTAELKASLDAVPEYLKKAYEAKHQIIFGELLKEHERTLKLAWWWRNIPFIFFGLSILFVILVKFTIYPGKVAPNSVVLSILGLFVSISIILICFSNMSERGHNFIAKKIEKQVEQFKTLIDRLSLCPGLDNLNPTCIKANLAMRAQELLKAIDETKMVRLDFRYAVTAVQATISHELFCQSAFDQMFGAVEELKLKNPLTDQPFERGAIFDQAKSILLRTVVSKDPVLASGSTSYSASDPISTSASAPPPQKPAGTP